MSDFRGTVRQYNGTTRIELWHIFKKPFHGIPQAPFAIFWIFKKRRQSTGGGFKKYGEPEFSWKICGYRLGFQQLSEGIAGRGDLARGNE